MKFVFLIFAIAQAQTALECKTSDFNAQTHVGHAISVELDKSGLLTAAHKLPGSFFCENVHASNFSVSEESEKVRTYNLHFNCNALNERLVVPKDLHPGWIRFEFTWADKDRYRRERSFLTCN